MLRLPFQRTHLLFKATGLNQFVKQSVREAARARPVKGTKTVERPSGARAFDVGRAAAAGASLVGLGALCYYGANFHKVGVDGDTSVLTRASLGLWPDYVKERLHSTYAYFGASLAVTAATAWSAFQSPRIMNVVARGGWAPAIIGMVALMGTGVACQALPYPADGGKFNAKHAVWLLHAGLVGAVVAPLCILGGPLIGRAMLYTAGVVGGLSCIAVTAPSQKFLNYGGVLGMGLGVVFVSCVGSMFTSPLSMLGGGLHAIALYGGMVVFSGLLLYNTQRAVQRAEMTPPLAYSGIDQQRAAFDPINNSIHIYMDTMNIFIRIVQMLAMSNSRRK